MKLAAALQLLAFDAFVWDGVILTFVLLTTTGVMYGIFRQNRIRRQTHGVA